MRSRDYNFFVVTILFVSFIFAYLAQTGFYGFNIDFYKEYHKSNLFYQYPWFDRLGAAIATLTISNIHLGVGVTSFILATSSGFLILSFFKLKKQNSYFIFLIIFLITLHVHPIIMSTSGAMRQGLAMAFLFFAISLLIHDRKLWSFISMFFVLFMHKSGIVLFALFVATFICLSFVKKMKNYQFILFIIIVLIFFLISSYGITFTKFDEKTHRVVYGDFRYLWLLINLLFIFFYLFVFIKIDNFKLKYVSTYLFLHAFVAISFLFMGLNYQYERINMIISMLLILVVGSMFKKKQGYIYILSSLGFYLFLTIYQGMYSIGLI